MVAAAVACRTSSIPDAVLKCVRTDIHGSANSYVSISLRKGVEKELSCHILKAVK